MPGAAPESAPPSAGSVARSVVARHAAREPATDGGWGRSIRNQRRLKKGRQMKTKFAAALFLLAAAGCAQQPLQPAESTPTTTFAAVQPAPAPVASSSDAQIAPGRWNVERVRCSDLLGASDEDRAAAAMFYYGYLAAKAGIHIIDVSQIDGNVGKVMSECAASPSLTVPQAFRQALRSRSPSR
jgi:hypothetical protein